MKVLVSRSHTPPPTLLCLLSTFCQFYFQTVKLLAVSVVCNHNYVFHTLSMVEFKSEKLSNDINIVITKNIVHFTVKWSARIISLCGLMV